MAIQRSNDLKTRVGGTNSADKSVDQSRNEPEIVIDGVSVGRSDDMQPTKSVAANGVKEPIENEEALRPKSFAELIGREKEKRTLQIMINAAKQNNRSLDHILFYGPPGLGKTTFANVIATEMGSSMHVTSGPAIEKQGDLAAILTNLGPNDILFIDEIHRLSKVIEEILYPAMEDGVLDIVMGKGSAAKSVRLSLEPFTLVGATTQIGKISSPMRDRFGLIQRLDYFELDDIGKIVERAARIESMEFGEGALHEVAKRSRGTGRVALRLFKRVRDFHQSESAGGSEIDIDTVMETLELLGIDQYGLEDLDRKILSVIMKHFDGGPVGLSTLAASVSEDINTISEVYEPFLLKLGLLQRTSRGRVLTNEGMSYAKSF